MYAAVHPQHVEALILVSSIGIDFEFKRYQRDNISVQLSAAQNRRLDFLSEHWRVSAEPRREFSKQLASKINAYFYDRRRFPQQWINIRTYALLNADRVSSGYNLRTKLKAFTKPVLIIQGRQEIIGESTAFEFRRCFLNLKSPSLENAAIGHGLSSQTRLSVRSSIL